MLTLASKAYPKNLLRQKEHLILRGFLTGVEINQELLNLNENLGDAYMTLDKILERATHIEAVTRVEEDN